MILVPHHTGMYKEHAEMAHSFQLKDPLQLPGSDVFKNYEERDLGTEYGFRWTSAIVCVLLP